MQQIQYCMASLFQLLNFNQLKSNHHEDGEAKGRSILKFGQLSKGNLRAFHQLGRLGMVCIEIWAVDTYLKAVWATVKPVS